MYKVLKDFRGSPNGFDVVDYQKGQDVELTSSLAETALAEKWVKPIAVKTDAEIAAEARALLAAEVEASRAACRAEIERLTAELDAAPDDSKPGLKQLLTEHTQALAALDDSPAAE